MKFTALKVAVAQGGQSSERPISLKTGAEVIKGLKALGHKVIIYDLPMDLGSFVRDVQSKRIDVVFNALHGRGGEDGAFQGLCELLRIPYTGSGIAASAIAMDKVATKEIYKKAGIPIAKQFIIHPGAYHSAASKNILRRKIMRLHPFIVKPVSDGSSVDVLIKPSIASLFKQLPLLAKKYPVLLAEEFIEGRECTVGVLDQQALPAVEIRPKKGSYTYEAKYQTDTTEKLCPAPLTPQQTKKAQVLALKAHRALGCEMYSRTDMILHPKRGWIVLETNTLPGLTPMSLLPREARVAGYTFEEVLQRLLDMALARAKRL